MTTVPTMHCYLDGLLSVSPAYSSRPLWLGLLACLLHEHLLADQLWSHALLLQHCMLLACWTLLLLCRARHRCHFRLCSSPHCQTPPWRSGVSQIWDPVLEPCMLAAWLRSHHGSHCFAVSVLCAALTLVNAPSLQ